MRPPILGLFPKVVPPGGVEYHGKFIPGGTNICMNTSSLLSSPALFGKDADIYRPERFTELSEEGRNARKRSLDLAFGHGQHQCLGKHIAMMELFKITFEVGDLPCPACLSLTDDSLAIAPLRLPDGDSLAREQRHPQLRCLSGAEPVPESAQVRYLMPWFC